MLETNLLEHDHMIKSCIQLTSADVDRAVELMNSYRRNNFSFDVSIGRSHSIFIHRIGSHEIHVDKASNCCGNHEAIATICG